MLDKALLILNFVLLLYMAFNVLYLTIYAFAAYLYKTTDFNNMDADKKNTFLIIVPVYKNDEIILSTIQQNLKQSYDSHKYEIVIVADSLRQSTLDELYQLPIRVIPVKFENSTKAKSINTVLGLIDDLKYDYCVVLDVDNVMEVDYLKKMNHRLQNGELVVQGHRLAKNLNTAFAVLDGVSEEINNQIFRKGHIALRVSASLAGSGKAVRFDFFKETMKNIFSPVEDKELELIILSRKVKILYDTDIFVYDEKVQSSKVFARQRRRWISSQFYEFNKVLLQGLYHLIIRKNFDYFDKTLQKVLMPRVLLWGVSFLLSFLVFFENVPFGDMYLGIFLMCTVAYLISVPPQYFNSKTIKASLRIPQAFALMFVALFRSKGATKRFIHTPHSFIDNVRKNQADSRVSGDKTPVI